MSSIAAIIGQLVHVNSIIEETQGDIRGASERMQSARGQTLGINEDYPSTTLTEICGAMNHVQEDMESVAEILAGINERIQSYVGVLQA